MIDNIVGHQQIKSKLESLITNKKLPHAIIFIGENGIGKKSLAFALANQLANATNKINPDLHYLNREEDKKDISADQIRELTKKLSLRSFSGGKTFAIIDNAHYLNTSAFNALLKTLEEPREDTFIILITNAENKILDTIVSRCQKFYFGSLDQAELATIIDSLNLNLMPNEISKLKKICQESLAYLDLEKIIDQQSNRIQDQKKAKKHFEEIIKFHTTLEKKINSILSSEDSSTNSLLAIASELAKEKEKQELIWNKILFKIREKTREINNKQDAWANILEQAIESRELCLSRNTNKELHLSTLFLSIEKLGR